MVTFANNRRNNGKALTFATLSLFFVGFSVQAQLLPTIPSFGSYTQSMQVVQNFTFGTDANRNVNNLSILANYFSPYGIAGTTVINQEWERYQPFNSTNFVLTPTSLDLTATIPAGGGLFPGGINSAQIWSGFTIAPGMTGFGTYAIEVRMKIPQGTGMWPAAWFFTKAWNLADNSEIDNPEFMNSQNQNTYDWTANIHGAGIGSNFFSKRTNPWVWQPGLDFAADYHNYQTIWTQTAVYRYVDGTLILADNYQWTSKGPAQLGVNLAVGSNLASLPGLQPNSYSEFPAAVSLDHIIVWGQ